MSNLTGGQDGWLSVHRHWKQIDEDDVADDFVRTGRLYENGSFHEGPFERMSETDAASEEFIIVGLPRRLANESDLRDE